jgi:PhoH-like ATPase
VKKNYVLDTNVLIHDPRAMFRFEDNHVIIPIHVLEEIDQFKKELSERGRNARMVSRYMDGLRAAGKLADGCEVEGGGTVRVAMPATAAEELVRPITLTSTSMDNKILQVALEVSKGARERTVFVTQDVNLRVRADVLGLRSEDYQSDKVSIDELYAGWRELDVPAAAVDTLFDDGELEPPDGLAERDEALFPNQYVMLRSQDNPSHTALSRFDAEAGKLLALSRLRKGVWGIRPRNREQQFALDLLLDDRIKLVTLVGMAGTGKTLLGIAAGLQRTVEEKSFGKLLVSRPIFPLGRDIGYLPGDIEDKLNPWMQPIFDNIELLMGITREDRHKGRDYQELIDMGYVEIEPLTYIRGRSIPNQFMLVDEAQNLTPHEVKTILTRCGEDTKIVLTGDAYQIDNPYVDSSNNGLTYVVERFKGQAMAGHVTLYKGERSPLAEIAAELL